MALSPDDIALRIKLDGLQTIESELRKFGADITSMIGTPMGKLGVAIGAVAVGMFALAKQTADTGEEFLRLSKTTGLTVEQLSAMRYAAEQSETAFSAFTTGLKFLNKNIQEAQEPGNELAAVFKALKVDTHDATTGAIRPALSVFLDLADRIASVEDPSIKVSAALKVFGRSGSELLPLLSQGGEGIRKLMAEAEAAGVVMSGQTAEASDELNDSLNRLSATFRGLGQQASSDWIPVFAEIAIVLGKIVAGAVKITKASFEFLAAAVLELAAGFAGVYTAAAKVTDLLGLTSGAAAEGAQFMRDFHGAAQELAEKAAKGFGDVFSATEAVAAVQQTINETKKETLKLSDAEIQKALLKEKTDKEAADADKERATQEKAALESLQQAIGNVLEVKKAQEQFDEEYFQAYAVQLTLQGKTVEQVNELILKSRQDLAEKSIKIEKTQTEKGEQIAAEALRDYLRIREQYGKADAEYFRLYASMLRLSGRNQTQIQADIALEAIRISKTTEEKKRSDVVTTNELIRTASQGVADALKGIWRGTTKTVDDAWKGALDNFVNVMAEMVVQSVATGAAISVSMAAASAGITLVVGLLASVFGGKDSGVDPARTKLTQATQTFLDSIKQVLLQFENDILTTLQKVTLTETRGSKALQQLIRVVELTQLIGRLYSEESPNVAQLIEAERELTSIIGDYTKNGYVKFREFILSQLDILKVQIEQRYELEKQLIADVMDLLKQQSAFVKDINRSITDVSRALFTPGEMFAAQQGDIQQLTAEVAAASGQERLDLIQDLRDAYLASFQTAQELFGEDPEALREWQQVVIEGLESLRESGIDAYDQLIQANLDILGVQRQGLDLEAQMVKLLADLNVVMIGANGIPSIFEVLGNIAKATPAQLPDLIAQLSGMLRTLGIGQFAHGGLVTRPTIALLGEEGPEMVVPLGAGPGGRGGTTVNQYFSGPALLDELSSVRWARQMNRALDRERSRFVR